jgi:hypothetical protein
MSIKLLSAAWDLDIGSTEKMVLMCLCDFANDDGGNCWPSVATLARKCSKSERTIQGAIKSLEEMGFLTVQVRNGMSNSFALDPRKICTPAKSAPPQKTTQTPADSAPKPSRTVSKDLADAKSKRARSSFPCPDGCDPTDWDSLLATRKAQRRPMTAGAYKQITNKLRKWADAGWPPGPILANAAERGWLTVFETDEMKRHDHKPPDNDEHRNPYVQAALERQAERAAAFGR